VEQVNEKTCPECGTIIKEGRAGKCRKCYERELTYSDEKAQSYWQHMAGGR
jgi:predicted RNA-binding Zn-ribbon protein involved in translation (DUF1610 family)